MIFNDELQFEAALIKVLFEKGWERNVLKNKTEQEKESRKNPVEYDYHVYALDWDREKLYERINKRVDLMIENGLIEEVKNILEKYNKIQCF